MMKKRVDLNCSHHTHALLSRVNSENNLEKISPNYFFLLLYHVSSRGAEKRDVSVIFRTTDYIRNLT